MRHSQGSTYKSRARKGEGRRQEQRLPRLSSIQSASKMTKMKMIRRRCEASGKVGFRWLISCGSDWRFGANRLVAFGPPCSVFALLFCKPQVDAWYVCFSSRHTSGPMVMAGERKFSLDNARISMQLEMFLQKKSRRTQMIESCKFQVTAIQ